MTLARGSGGKTKIIGGTLAGGDPIFVEVRLAPGIDFSADLVADPSNPADVAAAIGSDLEIVTEVVSQYGNILALAVESSYAEFIMDYGTAFIDPDISQQLFDVLEDDYGYSVVTIITTRSFVTYPWKPAT